MIDIVFFQGEFLNEAGQPLRIEVSTEEELAQMGEY